MAQCYTAPELIVGGCRVLLTITWSNQHGADGGISFGENVLSRSQHVVATPPEICRTVGCLVDGKSGHLKLFCFSATEHEWSCDSARKEPWKMSWNSPRGCPDVEDSIEQGVFYKDSMYWRDPLEFDVLVEYVVGSRSGPVGKKHVVLIPNLIPHTWANVDTSRLHSLHSIGNCLYTLVVSTAGADMVPPVMWVLDDDDDGWWWDLAEEMPSEMFVELQKNRELLVSSEDISTEDMEDEDNHNLQWLLKLKVIVVGNSLYIFSDAGAGVACDMSQEPPLWTCLPPCPGKVVKSGSAVE